MKRLFAALLTLALLPGASLARAESPAAAQTPAPSFAPAVIVSDNGRDVNLREGPSTDTRALAQYAPGTKVDCAFEEGAAWLSVRINGVTGYMMADYLSPAPPEATAEPLSLAVNAEMDAGYALSATLTENGGILTAHVAVTYASETSERLTGFTLWLNGEPSEALLPYSASEDPNEAAFHVAFYFAGEMTEAKLVASDGAEVPLSSP